MRLSFDSIGATCCRGQFYDENAGDAPCSTLPRHCHCFSNCVDSAVDVELAINYHLIGYLSLMIYKLVRKMGRIGSCRTDSSHRRPNRVGGDKFGIYCCGAESVTGAGRGCSG